MRQRLAVLAVTYIVAGSLSAGQGSFDEYKLAIPSLQVGMSSAEIELRLGSPYWRRISAEGGATKQEWAYPTSAREMTTLIFGSDNRLVATTAKTWPMDVMFIHDASPIMSARGRAKLDKLRTIKVGANASELRSVWKPDAVLPYAQAVFLMDELKKADAEAGGALLDASILGRIDNLHADLWMYRCGDVSVTYEVGVGERIVAVSEQLNPSKAQQKQMERSLSNRNW